MNATIRFEAANRYNTLGKHPNELMSEETFDDDSDNFIVAVKARADDLAQVWGQDTTARVLDGFYEGIVTGDYGRAK